jgi:hypothetical protein
VFEKEGLQPSTRLPVAKELGEKSLMFLVHPTLTAYSNEFGHQFHRKAATCSTGIRPGIPR